MRLLHMLILPAVVSGMTACSYTNHFLDEEAGGQDTPYAVMTDLDATAYDSWTYVNLETGETATAPDRSEWYYAGTGDRREALADDNVGIDWHIAVHRYDIRTNDAKALNTGVSDIEVVNTLPAGEYTADERVNYHDELAATDRTQYLLVMDMSQMMDGNIGYALEGSVNKVLCEAITRTDTGSMPPVIYGTTDEVIALEFPGGDWAAVKIVKTYGGSDGARSGMISFQYKFHRHQ